MQQDADLDALRADIRREIAAYQRSQAQNVCEHNLDDAVENLIEHMRRYARSRLRSMTVGHQPFA